MGKGRGDGEEPIVGTPENGLKYVQYVGLAELLSAKWAKNPKDHDIGEIHGSVNRFGFRGALLYDERSKRLVAGHGRLETMQQKLATGEDPPQGIVERGGEWFIPVIRGESFNSDAEVEAYVIADNRLVEKGGWLDDLLAEALQRVATGTGTLAGTGYTEDELDDLLRDAADDGGGEGDGDGDGEGDDDSRDPSDTQVQVGAYRIPVHRSNYEQWLEEVRQAVGFDDESIKNEIQRRLKI